MRKAIIFILMFILVISGVSAVGCGSATHDCSCNDTITNSYNMTGLSDLIGCTGEGLEIDASDIFLDCQGLMIQGDGDSGDIGIDMDTSTRNRINISNCHVDNFGIGIRTRKTDGSELIDIIISNSTARGMSDSGDLFTNSIVNRTTFIDNTVEGLMERTSGVTFDYLDIDTTGSGFGFGINSENNSIINSNATRTTTNSGTGFYTNENAKGNITFDNLYVSGFQYGIRINLNNPNSSITNSIVENCGLWCIATESNNTIFEKNVVSGSLYNSIFVNADDQLITNNTLVNALHHLVDGHPKNDDGEPSGDNITISHNTLYYNGSDGAGLAGINVWALSNVTIHNNTIYDITNTTNNPSAINIERTNTTHITIIDNDISSSDICIRLTNYNVTVQQNNFNGCDLTVHSGKVTNQVDEEMYYTFFNNTYTDGVVNMNFSSGLINATINETSSKYLRIYNPLGKITFLEGDFRKDVFIENKTITSRGLPAYNVYGNSTTAIVQYNVGSFTEIQNTGTIFLIYLSATTDPKPSSIATTITDINYTWSGSELTWTQSGTGSTIFTNLSQIGSPYQDYQIRIGRTILYEGNNNDYTFAGAFTWNVLTAGVTGESVKEDSLLSITKFTGSLDTIVTVIIAAFIIMALLGVYLHQELDFQIEELLKYGIIIIVLAILLSYGASILAGL